MAPPPTATKGLLSPKFPPRKPNREAMELLKHSPSALRDSTPPHLNTRSRRGKPVSVTSRAPPDREVSSDGGNEASPPEVKDERITKNTPNTPPSQRLQNKRSPLMDRIVKEDILDEDKKPESDLGAGITVDGDPPTPALNKALIETPRVDSTPRALRRKPFDQNPHKEKEGFESGVGTFDFRTPFQPSALESTKMITIVASDESSYARPPKWTLRQLSPIRSIEDAEVKSELTSSFAENTTFGVEDAAIQVSLCQKCQCHTAWSEMKPIVMIFTFLMLSLLYRGLLRVDPRLPRDFGNALGMAVQGTFLASFNMEDYLANIFGA